MNSIKVNRIANRVADCGGIASRVASDYLDKFREEVPTLWLENEAGDKWVPKLDGNDPAAPDGFVYQHSMFPDNLTESILKLVQRDEVDACGHPEEHVKPTGGWIDGVEGRECNQCNGSQMRNSGEPWAEEWSADGSRSIMTGNSSWSPDLALALVNRGGFDLRQAIIMSARSCERCMNVLADEVGLDWGYSLDSEDYQKCGTSCFFCDGEGMRIVNKTAGLGDVLNKIIRRIRNKDKAQEMGQHVYDYNKTHDDSKDLTRQETKMLYGPDDYGERTNLSKHKMLDIGWTNHAEYRSDLRDVPHEVVNKILKNILRERAFPQSSKKKKPHLKSQRPERMKVPGGGTAVVDYDLTRNPAKADVITVWASRRGL